MNISLLRGRLVARMDNIDPPSQDHHHRGICFCSHAINNRQKGRFRTTAAIFPSYMASS